MNFRELTDIEFTDFAKTNPLNNFYQTKEWATLKKKNNWDYYFVGILDDTNTILGATLLLAKKVLLNKKIFYAPRGFLIDFNNAPLLTEFTLKIKQFIKTKNGIFLKIDPYLAYQERDLDGNIVENGFNNKKAHQLLLSLKYKHQGFNLNQEDLQPRFIFTTTTKDRDETDILKNMDTKTRQIIRKNERLGMTVREIKFDELDKFKKIMNHTSERREFIDRPFSYYQTMYQALASNDLVKVLVAELDTNKILANINTELANYLSEYQEKEAKYLKDKSKMNESKYLAKKQEIENNIERTKVKENKIKSLKAKHGDIIILGGILYITYGKEVLSLLGGTYQEFMEFDPAYTLNWEMIKYAVSNNYERYNFYGISGDFRESNKLLGLYLFKRGFGGQVVELLGEYDLIVNKPLYYLYKLLFSLYHTIKNIKYKKE
ncbi:MAG: peptidoglycan bridge formation glycyltransferase FemA/FemB family protein [Bacilli bacterium]